MCAVRSVVWQCDVRSHVSAVVEMELITTKARCCVNETILVTVQTNHNTDMSQIH